MKRCLDEIDNRFVRRISSRARNLKASLLLLSAPQVDEDHQHARFNQIRVKLQRPVESLFRTRKIFCAAETLEDAIDVTCAKAVVSERERRIKLNRFFDMSNRRVAIFRRDRAEDE